MNPRGTLLLKRADVASLLSLDECISAVEAAFKLYGEGRLSPPGMLSIPASGGGFHIKTALLPLTSGYFAAKMNANFSANVERFNLPSIQGLIVLSDAAHGYPLAVLDSIEITILRTGAATAVAAKHLASHEARAATICGCGNQGRIQLRALSRILRLQRVFAFDIDEARAQRFAVEMSAQLGIEVVVTHDLRDSVSSSDVCVTCTPSREPFLMREYLRPGAFVAAVGADSPDKQELEATILGSSKVVTDILNQCELIGELNHALKRAIITRDQVHAELGEIVAGTKPGRVSADEIIVFDSTGTALQDAAAAALVYEKALRESRGTRIDFAS